MDPFDMDNVKTEKANAMMRYRRLQKLANLFRFLEVCLVLALLSWISTRLPIAFNVSGKYFRQLCVILISPRFVFLVGNAIVITLFVKSGQFSVNNLTGNDAGIDLYDEFIKKSENCQRIPAENHQSVPEEISCVDKQIVCEEITSVLHTDQKKIFRRSQSENLKLVIHGKSQREFRRSETEKLWKMENSEEKPVDMSDSEDGLSNEEFQRRIDAFIEKHQKFQREEESKTTIIQKQLLF